MRVALEMIPTSADILGVDTPKNWPSYRETIMPSIVITSEWLTGHELGGGGT